MSGTEAYYYLLYVGFPTCSDWNYVSGFQRVDTSIKDTSIKNKYCTRT